MEADRTRWDQRWADADADAIEPHPPQPIIDVPGIVDMLPPSGRALDVACGLGAQSLWLAERGYQVTALDVSPVAINSLAESAIQHGYDIDTVVWDADAGLPDSAVELSVVVCQRFRAPTLYAPLFQRLQPGGVLLLSVLSEVGPNTEPGPFRARPNELIETYNTDSAEMEGVVVLAHREHDGLASIAVRRG